MVDRGASLITALAVGNCGASIAEVVLGWVIPTTAARWLDVTDLDRDVLDRLLGCNVASAVAAVLSEPVSDARVRDTLAPSRDDEGHTVGNVIIQVLEVAAALCLHRPRVAALGEGGRDAHQVAISVRVLK